MSKKPAKKLWQIDLNWCGETHTFYRWSVEKDFALTLGIMALSQKVNLHWRAVDNYIRDGFDRYLITEVRKN